MRLALALARSLTSSAAGAARVARAAEAAGYDSIWVADHIAMPVNWSSRYPFTDDGAAPFDHRVAYTEALTTLAYLAGVTERIRLGSAVIPIITRDPLTIAKQAATVDILSDGRLELGLGAGWLLEEAVALGRPDDHPNGRLQETIEILRHAWSEDAFEYHGRFYDFEPVGVHPQPVQSHIPIWIGGVSPRLIRMAGQSATGTIVPARRPEQVLEMVRAVRAGVPATNEIAVVFPVGPDAGADRAYAEALSDAGATRLLAGVSYDHALAERQVDQFADIVLTLK
jgi:probable F420-dependent oxidoreductase